MSSAVAISKTKILPPRSRPELLSRTRLLEDLRASLDRKLILVSAPAGYGKTSLLTDLANHTKMRVCWLSLDPLDRDPQRFISYLIAALGERFPAIRTHVQPLLASLKSIEADADELIVALTNELYDQVEEDFLFILDDFHLLDGVPAISGILNRFLQLVDDNCHVILATRTLPDLPDMTLMVAREQIEGLGQDDLAFQPREIQALFAQNHDQPLSEQMAAELFQQSNGWITGLLLSDMSGGLRVAGVDTFSYLGRQVLDNQSPALRQFLLRTSVPDEFNAELCEEVLGPFHRERQNWNSLMALLIEKNLFSVRVGADGGWIRYHPLFREFLQNRLTSECPDEIPPILERLTRFYEECGEWEKAYFTCQQLYDSEMLASVVEHAGTYMLQHAFTTLENWMNSLPPSLTNSRPGLISLRGAIAIIRGNLQQAIALFNSAEAAYEDAENVEGLALVLTRRATAYTHLGKYELAMEHAEQVMNLTASRPDLLGTYAEALRIKGSSLYRLGHSREAIQHLEHSLSLFRSLNESGSIPMLLADVGIAYSAVGDLEAASSAYQEALKIWQTENNLPLQADVINSIAMLHQKAGEYERAVEALEQGLSLARKSRYPRAETVILIGLGDLYAEVGDYVSAAKAYEKAQPLASQWPGGFLDTYLILAGANLALLQEDTATAAQILKGHSRSLQANRSLYERGLRALIEGRMYLLDGQAAKAVRAFQECKQCFTQDGRSLEKFWSQVWLTAALGEVGQTEPARLEVKELTTQWARPNHAMLVMVSQAAVWLSPLQKDPELGRSLRAMLDKARRLQEKLPAIRRSLRRLAESVEMPVASLVIHAFGRGEVEVDGRTVTSSEWSTQSVRDLFFYFLYKGGAVNKEQIAAALWPDEQDPQILKQRFKTYIFRLRRATRRDVIIFDEEYYRFNYTLDYEYDVEAFETFLARARATRDQAEQLQHFQRAIDLVKGPYLEDIDMPWALGERERLEQIYLHALLDMADVQRALGQLDEAFSTAQRVVAIDPYREDAHRALMSIHAARGDRTAAHRQYQACKSALSELGVPISAETEKLYRELTR